MTIHRPQSLHCILSIPHDVKEKERKAVLEAEQAWVLLLGWGGVDTAWPRCPSLTFFCFFFFIFSSTSLLLPPISLHPDAYVLSHVTPWIAARQAPLSMDFSRQEYRSGLPFPSPFIDPFKKPIVCCVLVTTRAPCDIKAWRNLKARFS